MFQAKTFDDYLRDSWRTLAKRVAPKATFEAFWEEALRRGGHWADVPAAKVTLQPGVKVAGAARRWRWGGRSRPAGRPVLALLRRAQRARSGCTRLPIP